MCFDENKPSGFNILNRKHHAFQLCSRPERSRRDKEVLIGHIEHNTLITKDLVSTALNVTIDGVLASSCILNGTTYLDLVDERVLMDVKKLTCSDGSNSTTHTITGGVIGSDGKLGIKSYNLKSSNSTSSMEVFAGSKVVLFIDSQSR